MQKYPNKGIFIGFAENSLFSENFRTGYSIAIFMLTAKKLLYTNLAIFGFFLSNKLVSFGFRKFCLKLIEKITKKQKIMITNIFFSIFCIFLKNRRLGLYFQGGNEFCMQKYPNKGIFIVFAENIHFSENFSNRLQHGDFHANGQKLIYPNLASFHLTNIIHLVLGNFA